AFFTAFDVSIFNPQNERATCPSGEKPVVKRRAHIPDMQLACGRRSKPNPYFAVISHQFDGNKIRCNCRDACRKELLVRSFPSQRLRACLLGGDRGPALFPPLRGFGSRLRAGAQQRPRNSVMPPQLVFIYKGPGVAQTDGGCGKSAGNGPVATPDDRQSLAVKCSELKLGKAHARCSLAVYQKEILEQDP